MSELSEFNRWLSKTPPPCPATDEGGRECLLGIHHKGEHVWDVTADDIIGSLRRQVEGATDALRELAGDEQSYEPAVARLQDKARAALMGLGYPDPWSET